MEHITYNGWTTCETWCVNLWLANDQGSQALCNEWAEECIQRAIDDDESDIRNEATYELSKQLEEMHDESMPELTGVFADLLSHALGRVNWYEIAASVIGEITIYSAGWNMPGYMPDNPPAMFLGADDALEHIKDAMRAEVETALQNNESLVDHRGADEDETLIDSWKADSNGEFGQTFGSYHYFVTKL